MEPTELDVPSINNGISGWEYAIGNKQIGLEAGKTVLLGAYRHAEDSMRTYDLQDEGSVEDMIKEDKTVLLLKIRVNEQEEPSQG